MNMTAKERALKSVESTEDVPRLKQIVRLKNDGTSMSIGKAGTMDMSKAPEALVQEAKPTSIPKDIELQANKAKNVDEFINNNYFKVERNKSPSRSDYKITNTNGYLEFSIDKDNGELIIDMVEAYKKGQ
jgi:hypothetical protein